MWNPNTTPAFDDTSVGSRSLLVHTRKPRVLSTVTIMFSRHYSNVTSTFKILYRRCVRFSCKLLIFQKSRHRVIQFHCSARISGKHYAFALSRLWRVIIKGHVLINRYSRSMERADPSRCARKKDILASIGWWCMLVDRVKRAKADNYLAPAAPGHYHYTRDTALRRQTRRRSIVCNKDCISGYHLLLITCNYIGNSSFSCFVVPWECGWMLRVRVTMEHTRSTARNYSNGIDG